MKNLFKFIPLMLLTLFVLTACSRGGEQAEPEVGETAEVTDVLDEESIPEESVVEEPGIVPGVDLYDAKVTCKILKDEGARADCEMQVAEIIASFVYSDAVDTYDIKACKALPEARVARCEEVIRATGVTGPVSSADLTLFDEIVRGEFPEFDPEAAEPADRAPIYDKTKCGQLQALGLKELCEKRVSEREEQAQLEEIIVSGNVKDCDKLSEDSKIQCQEFFGIAPELPELSPPSEEPEFIEPELPPEPESGADI